MCLTWVRSEPLPRTRCLPRIGWLSSKMCPTHRRPCLAWKIMGTACSFGWPPSQISDRRPSTGGDRPGLGLLWSSGSLKNHQTPMEVWGYIMIWLARDCSHNCRLTSIDQCSMATCKCLDPELGVGLVDWCLFQVYSLKTPCSRVILSYVWPFLERALLASGSSKRPRRSSCGCASTVKSSATRGNSGWWHVTPGGWESSIHFHRDFMYPL